VNPKGARAADRSREAPQAGATALSQLLGCLQAEGGALASGDLDALAQAVHQKEQALQRLASELAGPDAGALREAVRRARDLNERNARLLMPHVIVNRARMEALFGAARPGTLYSADGRADGLQDRPAQRGVRA